MLFTELSLLAKTRKRFVHTGNKALEHRKRKTVHQVVPTSTPQQLDNIVFSWFGNYLRMLKLIRMMRSITDSWKRRSIPPQVSDLHAWVRKPIDS